MYNWNIVTGTTKRGGKPGPVAVLTRLGCVLSGPVIQENQGHAPPPPPTRHVPIVLPKCQKVATKNAKKLLKSCQKVKKVATCITSSCCYRHENFKIFLHNTY